MKSARVAACFVAVVALAGCGTPSGGTAFSVDGQNVSEKQVDDTARACAAVSGDQPSALRGRIAQLLLAGRLAPAIEKASGVQTTAAERSKVLDSLGSEKLLQDETCAPMVNGVADFAAIQTKLGETKLQQAQRQVDVKVNPSYGTWDSSTGSFSGTSGSLSREDLGLGQVFGG